MLHMLYMYVYLLFFSCLLGVGVGAEGGTGTFGVEAGSWGWESGGLGFG